ncbi:MAG: hypothetical protein A3C08_00185 [Candidatus Taylorbacteria bacterium RIFCSPHIGHO2_02_FULL_47_18]|uniref:Histidyl-tRNA synthetase n=1 Tax=Candidatus Taylorbacteria bacterium RIFCSPLOWO2_01_FULL_48_100 TaxID=1802322 RepID=A0A1G2NED0_9BACT|nr:MAG: hypothetical protein A2670_01790 [Candidatus Taylorbacteria bacterium RIFCSPHIGHO2_01_FULL_48_38]OHA27903.1 MAG: hypothetical protein A3C08_00185 [Candidatus Taylorbacteria bacterium RIFCSPHIGHO2_02_FULL_47_18]OHA34440.1 MAG: hypothetical protein A2938_01170 [Candidatus Taylorbacteria bacterium RIFCSPLOWO2_01_FULL_48_100]OHA40132.1 MAG: hypothetical protein A3J31_00910 [Candidatus Taylorbacteria bacterium RIFCSPLOWO2_02_FULL_48_16]OHA45533.1 MAG: hypothetical protein A3H13_01935 [Candid
MHPPVPERTFSAPPARTAFGLSRVSEIPIYYGFVPIEAARVEREDRVEEKMALIRRYEEEKMDRMPQPVMLYRETRGKESDMLSAHLDLLGSYKSIAEAILIKTAIETLRATVAEPVTLYLNSLGDRDSFGRFTRELSAFYRKNIADMHAPCRQALKENVCSLLSCEHGVCVALRENAPKPISFLSDASRAHFKEVLEYLERLNLPYDIKEHLVGPAGICSHTIFEMRAENGEVLASGFRYNHLARRAGARREIPCLGATLFVRGRAGQARARSAAPRSPNIYFIQLGAEAKLRSLHIMELLRNAGLPVAQSIACEKLSTQIAHAESLKTPYFIIIGQKEALDDTALVRDRERSFQETLPVEKLAGFLKRLLK